MKKQKYLIGGVMILLMGFLFSFGVWKEGKKAEMLKANLSLPRLNKTIQTAKLVPVYANNSFLVEAETAISNQEKIKGLMGRRYLPDTRGMLFIWQDEEIRSFWMKNTLIPLDMIFIAANNQIVDLKENVQPCKTKWCETYASKNKAKYVLEVNAGLCNKYGIKLGNIINF